MILKVGIVLRKKRCAFSAVAKLNFQISLNANCKQCHVKQFWKKAV